MPPGVLNIILGLVGVGLGLSGKMQLIGTNSSEALAVVGGVIAVIGVVQLVRHRARVKK